MGFQEDIESAARRLTKEKLVAHVVSELTRIDRARKVCDDQVESLRKDLNKLQGKYDDLASVQKAIDGVVKLRALMAGAGVRDVVTLSLFPELPKNTDSLDDDDAKDLESVLHDIVDKSASICGLLEETIGLDTFPGDERDEMLRALGMSEFEWMIARGRK